MTVVTDVEFVPTPSPSPSTTKLSPTPQSVSPPFSVVYADKDLLEQGYLALREDLPASCQFVPVDTTFFSWSKAGDQIVFQILLEDKCNRTVQLHWVGYSPVDRKVALVDPEPFEGFTLSLEKFREFMPIPEMTEPREVISPSGEILIFSKFHGESSYQPGANTTINLYNRESGTIEEAYEFGFNGTISDIAWSQDEAKVLFDFGGDGGHMLYLYDLEKKEGSSIEQVSRYTGFGVTGWSLSPDNHSLAVAELSTNRLWIVSLADETTIQTGVIADYPTWTKDGKWVCYWACGRHEGVELSKGCDLDEYNVETGAVKTKISGAALLEMLEIFPFTSQFFISPDSSQILFQGTNGYGIVTLPEENSFE